MTEALSLLGKSIHHPIDGVETFEVPKDLKEVLMVVHEFTSLCPVTGQPDYGEVVIHYRPKAYCIESKSLKLWLWGFRQRGAFCESLASEIANDLAERVDPYWVEVEVRQASRGGIKTSARAEVGRRDV